MLHTTQVWEKYSHNRRMLCVPKKVIFWKKFQTPLDQLPFHYGKILRISWDACVFWHLFMVKCLPIYKQAYVSEHKAFRIKFILFEKKSYIIRTYKSKYFIVLLRSQLSLYCHTIVGEPSLIWILDSIFFWTISFNEARDTVFRVLWYRI